MTKFQVFATLQDGTQTQINVWGNSEKIVRFIETYQGDDLGNDLICENFVEDFEETGVTIAPTYEFELISQIRDSYKFIDDCFNFEVFINRVGNTYHLRVAENGEHFHLVMTPESSFFQVGEFKTPYSFVKSTFEKMQRRVKTSTERIKFLVTFVGVPAILDTAIMERFGVDQYAVRKLRGECMKDKVEAYRKGANNFKHRQLKWLVPDRFRNCISYKEYFSQKANIWH